MLEGVKFMAFELAKRQYKKVPRNLTNGAPLCIIILQRWGGYLPHGETYHTQGNATHYHTQPRRCFYILCIAEMTKQEKLEILNAPSLWYWSGCCGLEFKKFEYGINDYALFVADAWTWHPTAHRAKIRYSRKGEPFLMFHGYTVKFSDTVRAWL